jgi:hypothetical protein
MTTMSTLELVEQFLRLVDTFDFEGVLKIASPTATVWHNDGKGEEALSVSSQRMKQLSESMQSMRYRAIRTFVNGDEALQQHVLSVALQDGTVREVHAAMYFRFAGGLLERVEEYATMLPPEAQGAAPVSSGRVNDVAVS